MSLTRDEQALYRVLQLAQWVVSRGRTPFTRGHVEEVFDDYRGESGARLWNLDKDRLEKKGFRIECDFHENEYRFNPAASRATRPLLTARHLELLEAAATHARSVEYGPVAHHIDIGLRKLSLVEPALLPVVARLGPVQLRRPDFTGELLNAMKGAWIEGARFRIVRHSAPVALEDVRVIHLAGNSVELETGEVIPLSDILHVERLTERSTGAASARQVPGRSAVTPLQRTAELAHLLLHYLQDAGNAGITKAEAARRIGVDGTELPGIEAALKKLTLDPDDDAPLLTVTRKRLCLDPRHRGAFALALRPIEAAFLIVGVRAAAATDEDLESLQSALVQRFSDVEREMTRQLVDVFRL